MATFQKPENALRRAEELIEVGKKQDALDTLHAAVQHKRFKNQWSSVIEEIVCRHLQLCVELRRIRTAREALHQYRTTCQAANIGSLEIVVQKFRKAAEEKVNEAKKLKDLKTGQMEDLDEVEAPQTILLRAIQASDTRQQSQDRDVHEHFRFLWETYKVILDVLKSNARLEEVYHETARHAFEFCRENTRPAEFKRLCETIRKNYLDLFKRQGAIPQHQVNPNNPDTVNRTLETRCRQLQISTELDLWKEAYTTAKEMTELMNKCRPKPHLRSTYYDYLGQIFWKSEEYLFHAFACLKNLLFVKAAKQNITKQELQLLASKAVLAAICVPFQKPEISASLELTAAEEMLNKSRTNAALFNAQTVPTRESIIAQLQEKGLVSLAIEPCQKLFSLIESDFTPLSLCQDAKPYLENLNLGEIFDTYLPDYVTPLKQIIFFRLTKQLSEVYASMTIENFEKAASIVPFSIAEKWMANTARQQGINIQINYIQKAIVFGSARKVDMRSMRQPLIEIGHKLQQAMQRVAPEEQHKKETMEKQQISRDIEKRVDQETKQIRLRKEEIERRKEASERRKEIQMREELEKERKKEAREAEVERVRQAEERKRREQDREELKRKEAEMAKNKEMLDQMKKQAEQRAVNLKVAGKKITEIEADDLQKISFDQIEKARDQQLQRERQEKIRLRKLESKRIDHLARAMREESFALIDEWAMTIKDKDNEFLDQAEERNASGQRAEHEAGLVEKRALEGFAEEKNKWAQEKLDERYEVFEEECQDRILRCLRKVVDLKIERAIARKAKYEKQIQERREQERKEREEEERRIQEAEAQEERERYEAEKRQRDEQRRIEREREEEEERIRAEERAEKKKKEDEERAEQRQRDRKEREEQAERAEQKRRQREKEIEERAAKEREERAAARAPQEKKEEDTWRRPVRRDDGDDKNNDNWRSAGARGDAGGGGWRDRASGGDRGAGRGDGDEWRRPGPRANADEEDGPRRKYAPPGARGEGEGGWRDRPAGGDRAPARGDDDRRRGSVKDDDENWRRPAAGARQEAPARSNAGDAGERRPTPPWKRKADANKESAADTEGPSRVQGSRDAGKSKGQEERGGSAWGRGPPAREDPPAARVAREEPSAKKAAAPEPEPPKKDVEPPAPAPPQEEDDGFETVTTKKKGKKADAPWRK